MYLDIIVLIIGCVFLVVLMFVVPMVFHNRQARVARYFRRNKDIRFELVRNVSKNPATLPNDLSQMEMVALLTVITFKDTVSGVLQQHKDSPQWVGQADLTMSFLIA